MGDFFHYWIIYSIYLYSSYTCILHTFKIQACCGKLLWSWFIISLNISYRGHCSVSYKFDSLDSHWSNDAVNGKKCFLIKEMVPYCSCLIVFSWCTSDHFNAPTRCLNNNKITCVHSLRSCVQKIANICYPVTIFRLLMLVLGFNSQVRCPHTECLKVLENVCLVS